MDHYKVNLFCQSLNTSVLFYQMVKDQLQHSGNVSVNNVLSS